MALGYSHSDVVGKPVWICWLMRKRKVVCWGIGILGKRTYLKIPPAFRTKDGNQTDTEPSFPVCDEMAKLILFAVTPTSREQKQAEEFGAEKV
ncbi:MAG: hypothetical protein SQA66_11465 [Candidatus Fervidibacter sacchari]